jgi:SHS2 domain-containing protein
VAETLEGTYRLLEHTADMGIEASAGALSDLFLAAAQGLLAVAFGNSPPVVAREEVVVALEAGDVEELLVSWLNEILYLMVQRSFCPAEFSIETIDDRHLRGRVGGEVCGEGREPVREVKAATYHRICVRREKDRWQARVYVDI